MRAKIIGKHASGISLATLISRILGYLRDMLVAQAFGAGLFADAFYAAYRIPNLLRRLLGEGALSSSFVPVFTEYLCNKEKKETQNLLNIVFTSLLTILLILTTLGIIFAPQITTIIAWGFTDDANKLELTISLTRLMFPYLLFICLAALMLATLNSLHIFFVPAIAPVMLSIAEIAYILGISKFSVLSIQGLAIAVTIGGLGQFLYQLPSLRRQNWTLSWDWRGVVSPWQNPGWKRIVLLMLPAMLGFSVEQINSFVDTVCASFLREGSVTALYYSNRVMQLPLALFGIAVATVSLPLMSKSAAEKNIETMKETISSSLRMIIFAIVPASVGLMVLAQPIIRLLFEYGAFRQEATQLTAQALFYYSIGLLAYSTVKVFVAAFYSLQDTKTPVKTGMICLIINAVLNIILMQFMGVGGLALATAISSYLNLTILVVELRKKIGLVGGRNILIVLIKVVLSATIMGILCYFLAYHIFGGQKLLSVLLPLVVGIIVYLASAYLFRINEFRNIVILLQKKFGLDTE